jgi:tetratricopeptide (TPR) repeat protein
LAQSRKPEPPQEFYNPLEITTPDPLLPQLNRPLSIQERLKLTAALDELNQQAAARLAAGDPEKAFAIWSRELRLRRALGIVEEIPALGRVGAIAWQENRRLELNAITRRLQEIGQQIQALPPDKTRKQQKKRQTQASPPASLELLNALGIAFQQVREPNSAIAVYEKILAIQRQQQDSAAVETTLRTIAELHLSWFNYPPAAAVYEQLLQNATERGDRLAVINYLQQLDYIYEQAKQYQQALVVKQRLGEIYQQQQQNDLLPALHLESGRNYEALGQLEPAFTSYQQAYTSAWDLQQYAQASDALRQMIQLYRAQGQNDAALQTSQILLESDRLASNSYGMMNTYDQIGQINLNRGNYPQALAAFQRGLELAQQLKDQENYFAQRIQQIKKSKVKS